MRIILAVFLCLSLNGCFFFYIPGSVIDAMTGQVGNNCIPEGVKEGDSIRLPDGTMAKVKRISGPSNRCKADKPIRAELVVTI